MIALVRRPLRAAVLVAGALVVILVPPAMADGPAAAPFSGTYQVLSASLTATAVGTGPGFDPPPCEATDGTSQYAGSISSPQPVDPLNTVASEDGSQTQGQINASTDTGTVNTVIHGCNLAVTPHPPSCTDSSSSTFTLGWGMLVEADAGSTTVKITWTPPVVGVNSFGTSSCATAPFRSPTGDPGGPFVTHEPVDRFVSADPQTFVVSGRYGGATVPISVGVDFTERITIQRVPGDLAIRTSAANRPDTNAAGAEWPFDFSSTWDDGNCGQPPPKTPSPLAYIVLGADRQKLTGLLKVPQASLMSQPGFATNAFRLGTPGNAHRITAGSKSLRGSRLQKVADALHPNSGKVMSPGNGVFYGARIACTTGQGPKVATAAPRVLCKNNPQLPGAAWAELTPAMKAKLLQLYGVLHANNICFALKSGFRSTKEQDKLYDDWHNKADRPDPADRTQSTLNQLCPGGATAGGPLAGFIQCPTGWTSDGTAKNGPAKSGTSRHNLGEAADLRLAFGAVTGRFDPSATTRKADVLRYFNGFVLQVPGLCPSSRRDPGHVELPYAVKNPKTGVVDPPKCRFSDGVEATPAATRRAGASSRVTDAARSKVNALARKLVQRSWTDQYIDWEIGRCRKAGRGVTCKLTIFGERATAYACRTEAGVLQHGRRQVTLLYGRRTRCR
ncbi:MAG: D-alanyl-D-alanine carboxypeptidase family protein [Solirubrobacteraceae bacterium]